MKKSTTYNIRNAIPSEFSEIGTLMVSIYSNLQGFPSKEEQPAYYQLLLNIGEFTKKPGVELLVAISDSGKISGAIVYFSEMQYYGSGGAAPKEKNASGFRLLAVGPKTRGQGLGKMLSNACIQKARDNNHNQVIIHTTKAMQIAWNMYENLGFKRSEDLDFIQDKLEVYGFRLIL